MERPRVLTAAALAVSGGGSWDAGPGVVVSRARQHVVLVFEAVSEAVAAAGRAAAAGASCGLAAGEVSTGGDWWVGPALDVAATLGARAAPGQVLATAMVPALAPRNGERWAPLGLLDVGVGDRLEVVELMDERRPAATGSPVPLPRLLAIAPPFPFVPREEPWSVLEQAWAGAATGGRQLVLVAGSAGTGKTRLASEFARRVHAQGGAVLYGGCSDRLAAPYQPFAEAIAHFVRARAPDEVRDLVGAGGAELSRVAPVLTEVLDLPQPPAGDDPDAVRYRLFGAMSSLLGAVAVRRPVLLVLDDMHWAGRPTVQMLDHLSRDSSLTGVVIMALYRSVPAEVGDALREALPDLRRQPGVARIPLSGFDHEGIRRFVAGAAGAAAAGTSVLDAVTDLLAAQTGGNAFLMGELWRHLVDAGYVSEGRSGWHITRPLDDVASPEGVREVVEMRLEGLPDETRRLLEVAAVVGSEFSTAVVAGASGLDQRRVLGGLDPAVRAGLVEEAGPGEHRFAHALVRRSVVDNLGPAARRALHLDVGRALGRHDPQRVSEIAHHLTAAVPLVESDEAVEAGRRAASGATAAVAFDDAARHLEAVLPLSAGRARCELLLELADARMRAGDVATALERCLECGAGAAEMGEDDLVVEAALAYDDANWRAALHGGVAEQLLRDALPLAADAATEVRVEAALSRALAFTGRDVEARALADKATVAARELGDHAAIRVAMSSVLFVPWTAETIDHQVAIARELLERTEAAGDIEWLSGAHNKLLYGLITLGELDEAREVARRFDQTTSRTGQPLFRVLGLQVLALLAVGEGRLADAESLAEEANVLSSFLSGTDAEGGYGVQIFTIRREQGRLDEARPLVEAVARLGQEGSTWRPALTVLYAELGLLDDAARELTHLVADDLRAVPRDSLYGGSLTYLADAAVAVGDRAAAAVLYDELLPYRHLVVQVGSNLAAYGAADRCLGELAALMGRVRDAESHFETALRLDGRAHMPVWLAHSQLAYGRALVARGRSDDRERARGLLTAAADTAARLGLARVAQGAAVALAEVAARPPGSVRAESPWGPGASGGSGDGVAPAVDVGLTDREVGVLRLVVDGLSNREIGERLLISQHTAANHVRSILLKTGCANRTEAASWALRRGLIAR
ncbi:MAG TPA: AAA family ATPase [Acidimicrobiales bacterium]|nr:AAA family ATPase [Acidimicrobiales bacterium]